MGYWAESFLCESNETLAEVVQKRHPYPILESVAGQVGWGFGATWSSGRC